MTPSVVGVVGTKRTTILSCGLAGQEAGEQRSFGILKNEIKEAILEGKIRNNYNDAYTFMLEQADQMGIEAKKRQ